MHTSYCGSLCRQPGTHPVLLQRGADINDAVQKTGYTALHAACQESHLVTVRELVLQEANVEAKSNLAAWFNRDDCVRGLIEDYNASVNVTNKSGSTPLHRAAFGGHVDVITRLASNVSCDINITNNLGRNALHVACIGGDLSSIHELTKHGFDVDAVSADIDDNSTPLHLAAYFNHKDCVYTLIEFYKASVNAKDARGCKPLILAALKGNTDIVS